MTAETPNAHPRDAWQSHVIPFVAWIFLMQFLGDPAGWKYAVRSGICILLFLWLRPWRWYARFNPKNLGWALLAGVGVFVMWIAMESEPLTRVGWLHHLYLTVGTLPPWSMAEPPQHLAYAPETTGWALTLTRIAGSAFVIAFIEEFFWRGWMYRWAETDDFLSVDLGKLDWRNLIITSLLFASVHHRWLVGFLCGIVYGLLAIKTRDIWAAGIAHMLTNLLLGIYVVWGEHYTFWA